MPISCVYCGSSHANAADVRACWQRTEGVEVAVALDVEMPVEVAAPPSGEPSPIPAARIRPRVQVDAVARRGPHALGRNVVIQVGDEAPAEWADAPRVRLATTDLSDAAALAERLRDAAVTGVSVVFELGEGVAEALAAGSVAVEPRPPHVLGPRFGFHLATLHHLVWSNSIDLRDASQPRWQLLDAAAQLGARPSATGEAGDVVLADESSAWLDGGPIRFTAPVDAVPVVHRVAVVHGSLTPFSSNDASAAQLAPDQLAAVADTGGASRIIAPAGSGKTRVLTERARHVLRRWPLPTSAVCVVAFNKRAQEEIRARTGDLRGLHVRTLNAIALAIVNGSPPFAPRPRPLRTIDEADVRRIIGSLVAFPRRRNADPVAPWIEALSLARLGLRDPSVVEAMYDGEVDGFAAAFPRYRSHLAERGLVDFDEQIQLAIEVLLTEPAARAAAQHACQVMLVDEFQDLTPAHVLLVRLLAGADAAVFGVGDDDQTIYGYNGADPAWLIEFGDLFPGSTQHQLEVNYRCPGGVVAAADTLLQHNVRRVPKTIRSAKPSEHGWSVQSTGDSVGATTAVVRQAIAAGRPALEVAVLSRVNSLLAPVQVALAAAGVPVSGGVGGEFAERTAVRAALAWLRLSTGGGAFSAGDLAEAIRRPARPLRPNIATWVTEQRSLDGIRRLAKRITVEREAERVEGFADDVERLRQLAAGGATTVQLLDTLRDSMGLASTITTLDVHRRGMNRAAQSDDLTAIAQLAGLQPDPRAFEAWLRAHLSRPSDPTGVTLATVHRVKGQEWPLVVVHHADDDQFPHRLADDVEEERRLFHVALTRASHQVVIVVGASPSPFIAELTEPPSARRTRLPSTADAAVQRRPPAAAAPAQPRASRPGVQLAGADAELFEALRSLRRHLAGSKPAYTVLADATLESIALAKPRTLGELAALRGIGPTKLDLYGSALLATVEAATSGDAQPDGDDC